MSPERRMGEQIKDFMSCFLGHYHVGVALFGNFHPTAKPQDVNLKAAIDIVCDAMEMMRATAEVATLTNIFGALDETGQGKALPFIEIRLREIATVTKAFLAEGHSSEATAKECRQLQTDMKRFFDALRGAHSIALLACASEQQTSKQQT